MMNHDEIYLIQDRIVLMIYARHCEKNAKCHYLYENIIENIQFLLLFIRMYLMVQASIYNMLFFHCMYNFNSCNRCTNAPFSYSPFPPPPSSLFWGRFHVGLFAENSQLYLNIPNTYHRQINFIADKQTFAFLLSTHIHTQTCEYYADTRT